MQEILVGHSFNNFESLTRRQSHLSGVNLCIIQPEGLWESHNEIESKNLATPIFGIFPLRHFPQRVSKEKSIFSEVQD